jgi:hypothetical protein
MDGEIINRISPRGLGRSLDILIESSVTANLGLRLAPLAWRIFHLCATLTMIAFAAERSQKLNIRLNRFAGQGEPGP